MRRDDQGRRLCSAHRQDGAECRAPAVRGAQVCRFHGAAKGTPGREAADRLTLTELIGPALAKLKELLEDPATPPAVQLGTAREILTRTQYGNNDRPADEQIMVWVEELIAEAEAERDPEEVAEIRRGYRFQ